MEIISKMDDKNRDLSSQQFHESGCKRAQVVVRKLSDDEASKASYSAADLEALGQVKSD